MIIEIKQDIPIDNNIIPRIAARAIIKKGNKYALSYLRNLDGYMTIGGGIKEGKSLENACIRETLEEVGLNIKVEKKIVSVIESFESSIWEHNYFLCTLTNNIIEKTQLTSGERKQGLELTYKTKEEIINIFTKHSTPKVEFWSAWQLRELLAFKVLFDSL